MGLGLDLCVIGTEGHGIEQDQNQREDHQPDQHPGHALPDPFGPAVFDGQLLIDPGQLFGDLVGRGLRGHPGPQQLADRDLQDLRQADQQVRVGDGQAGFPNLKR